MSGETTGSEIAVVGRAGRFPGAAGLEAFWRNLAAGVESITFFTPEELRAAGIPNEVLRDPAYVPARGVLAGAEAFDAGLFGMSPREARITDPQHRVFLECAWEALEDAGCDPGRFPGLVGVFAGCSLSRYMLAVHGDPDMARALDPFQLTVANDKDFLATRVSYKLGLEGPAFTVQTACSTSLVAVHLACQSLLGGECDLALAGGVSAPWPQESGYVWSEGMVLSPDGHTRAFDARGQGTVAGHGVGIAVLRRLEDALAADDPIRAVIRGTAINNDGSRKVGYTAPRIEGQARVIRAAQIVAEVDARSLGYVEAHGTGTPLGDPIEIAALTRAFRATTKDAGFCAIGSVKTNIGHLDAAAGIAGLIKTVLALEHRQIPPSLHCDTPNPQIDFADSPFFVNRELRDWLAGDGGPRRAGVSSFGIGGTNAHAILEEAPPREPSGPAREHQLLILSARTEGSLDAAAERLAAHLEARPADLADLADAAYTLRVGRRELEHRRAVVCRDATGAVTALRSSPRISGQAGDGRAAAFLFPGLGGQHPGMAAGLLTGGGAEPLFRKEIETCAEILRPLLGFDPLRLFLPPPGTEPEAEELLGNIAVSMPVLFALEQSLGRLWLSWGIKPKALLGHSLGEYAAACLAGVFSTEDGARIMAARGRLLAELPPGGMISVPLSEEECAPHLVPGQLWLATINGPRTCVLSGTPEALDEAERRLAAEGRTARRVRARGAYHSGMIDQPMLDRFRAEVAKVRLAEPSEPSIPFLSNLTGTWIRAGQATDPGYWTEHLRSPVRFADDLAELLRDPGIVPVEVGPGRTLATLAAERLAGSRPALTSLRHPQETAEDAAVLYASLGRLWAEGVAVDWTGFAADERRLRVPLPTYAFERQRYAPARRPLLAGIVEIDEVGEIVETAEDFLPDLADWFQVPVWKQAPPLEPSPAPGGSWLLFTPGSGPAEALARRLEERGDAVARVEIGEGFRRLAAGRYALDPGYHDGYDALLAALDEDGLAPAGVIHAWCLETSPPGPLSHLPPTQPRERGNRAGAEKQNRSATLSEASPLSLRERGPGGEVSLRDLLARAETATALGFHSLLALAQAVGRRGGSHPLRLTVLSEGLHRVAGETAPAPERATLLGPVLVIPRELPGAVCRSVDLTVSEETLDALLAELDAGGPPVVALRDGSRWVPGFEPVRLDAPAEPPSRLREGGTYLITGGVGAMGLAFAERFARHTRVNLALVSRNAEASGRVRRIESLGSAVMVLRADAADPDAMAAAVAAVKDRFGPIHGAIHAAGVLGAGLLQSKTREAAGAVLDPKVRGALILDHLLRGEPLDFLVLCSSISALSGALGQVDYCAANAFLDAFARWRGRPAVAVDWDRWQGEGMAHAVREVHPLLGVRLEGGPDRIVFAARLGAASSWVLDEHRLLERPILPGTAYLEMARAACEAVAGAGPVEIGDVLFWTPLMVPAGQEAEVRAILDRREDGSFVFQVLSAEPGPEPRYRRHATGTVRPLEPAEAAAARERAGRVRERFATLETAPEVVPGPESLAAAFGPRWHCLRRYRFAGDEGLADISLDAAHAHDVEAYRLHPALLDAATGFTSAGLTEGFHLPLSYRTVRVLAPLAAAVRSWGRGRGSGAGTFSADVVVTGLDGEPLVEIEEFTKRRIDPGQGEADLAALESGQPGVPGTRDRSLVDAAELGIPEGREPGMLPGEGAEALVRILGTRRHLPQVVVATRSLTGRPARRRAAAQNEDGPAPRSSRRPAPVIGGSVEETLRRLWSEVLGVAEVGVHDNFFALGGDSILGLQVVARAREAGLELAPGQIFEHQTVAALAAVLDGGGKPPAAEEAPAAFTPGDFPLAGMDEAGLGRLFEQIAAIDSLEEDEP
jgi:acyl transferase domain-containing protein